ncbi:MAG: hypothetical protein IJW37_06335 [Lachnospiraceae bacterium]|nr:hypothetical protein [Lachnospiraceae bacterium]
MIRESVKRRADELMEILTDLPMVKSCKIYGSLATNTHDELSDIDIELDVSGCDNGQFMLELTDLLKDKLTVYYSDYAPSLVPEKYIVSIAIDETNPFLIVDLCCSATPHCTSVTKQQVREKNHNFSHMLKLWTANLKHYVRGTECRQDIVRMVGKLGIEDVEAKDEASLLEETLCWLESKVDEDLDKFIAVCRTKFEALVL